jgi:hypothetical protein
MGVAIKPVYSLRLQHIHTARLGLRSRHRRPRTPTALAVPLRWHKGAEGDECLAAPVQPAAFLCHREGPVLHGIRQQLHFLGGVVRRSPCGRSFSRTLCRAMADLVDGRTQRRLPGVEPGLLHGSPREGGFGLLPVTEHVHACHAK